jgi:predicted Rossmann-fold nucleotide-binding protein
MGADYWSGLIDWVRARMLAEGKISSEDLSLISVTDDPADVRRAMQSAAHRQARRPE